MAGLLAGAVRANLGGDLVPGRADVEVPVEDVVVVEVVAHQRRAGIGAGEEPPSVKYPSGSKRPARRG